MIQETGRSASGTWACKLAARASAIVSARELFSCIRRIIFHSTRSARRRPPMPFGDLVPSVFGCDNRPMKRREFTWLAGGVALDTALGVVRPSPLEAAPAKADFTLRIA